MIEAQQEPGPVTAEPGAPDEHRLASRVDEVETGHGRLERLAIAYRDHGAAVYRLASRICGSACASDVTQEVFLALWHHPERFDPSRGSLRTFVLTIAHHKAVQQVRSETAHQRRTDRLGRAGGDVVEPPAVVLARERAEAVTDALQQLPPAERDSIVTAFYGGCSYREAAVILGLPEGTVKSRIRSGLVRLGSMLADHTEGDAGVRSAAGGEQQPSA